MEASIIGTPENTALEIAPALVPGHVPARAKRAITLVPTRRASAEVVLITRDSRHQLARSLSSIRAAAAAAEADLLIVDCGSTDGTRRFLAEHAPGARAVWLEREDGLADALAAASACSDADVLILARPSMVPTTGDGMRRLVDHLSENPCAAAAAPALCDPQGEVLPSTSGIPTVTRLLSDPLSADAARARRDDEPRLPAIDERDEIARVESVLSAVVALRRSDLDRVIGSAARMHPDLQPLDLWIRLKALGREIHYLPAVECRQIDRQTEPSERPAAPPQTRHVIRLLLAHPRHLLRPPWISRVAGGSHLAAIAHRTFDVVIAASLLVLLAPVLMLVALAVRIDSPGPVLFRQRRLGHRAKPFVMYKFRTMRADADHRLHEQYVRDMIVNGHRTEQGGAQVFKIYPDPRVTRIGRFLRRTSIDELPQLYNVLRGEMTLVGFRPPIPYEVAHYPGWYHRRFDGKPGLTGLWQVSGRNERSYEEMVGLDIEYINRRSWLLDLSLLLRTLGAVIRRQGAY